MAALFTSKSTFFEILLNRVKKKFSNNFVHWFEQIYIRSITNYKIWNVLKCLIWDTSQPAPVLVQESIHPLWCWLAGISEEEYKKISNFILCDALTTPLLKSIDKIRTHYLLHYFFPFLAYCTGGKGNRLDINYGWNNWK